MVTQKQLQDLYLIAKSNGKKTSSGRTTNGTLLYWPLEHLLDDSSGTRFLTAIYIKHETTVTSDLIGLELRGVAVLKKTFGDADFLTESDYKLHLQKTGQQSSIAFAALLEQARRIIEIIHQEDEEGGDDEDEMPDDVDCTPSAGGFSG